MNIPLNGRIAIVDDKYKEVKPLMNFFSKKRIPFNYYSGSRTSELPKNSNDNPISLLFLDLNIVESQHNHKAVISTLHPILKSLCPGNSIPYFLIIWSKKIQEYGEHLERHFKSNVDLKSKPPVKFIYLNKSDFFDYEDGVFLFDESKYELLIKKLKESIDNISLLNNFLTWENIVHSKAKETTSEFCSFYNINDEWDQNTKAVIFHLAKAIIGNDDIKSATDEMRLLAAFNTINSFLSEKIHTSILDNKLGEIKDIKDLTFENDSRKDGLKNGIKEKINSKLHLITNKLSVNSFEQGNAYKTPNSSGLIKQILFKEKYNNNKIVTSDILKSRPALIQLDITPVCDYSQDKKYIRLIHGIMLDAKFSAININSHFQRQTPNFDFEGKQKFLVLDYRFISTTTKNEVLKRNISPLFRLRREICTDIQSQLANQINRPGISSL